MMGWRFTASRTCHVQGNRIERGKHPYIRHYCCVVFPHGSHSRGDIDYQADVEVGRPSITAFVYSAIFLFRISLDSSDAGRTASLGQTPIQRPHPTAVMMDGGLAVCHHSGVVGANFGTHTAANAEFLVH